MHIKTLAIVGVGLVGGSIALAARARGTVRHILGVARKAEILALAQSRGMIDEGFLEVTPSVPQADLAIVCTPVKQIARQVKQLLALSPLMTVSDVGSSKQEIVETVEREASPPCRFVGGHPLAGSEKNGPEHAQADLFEKKIVFLTSTTKTDQQALKLVKSFWQALGAVVVDMPPQQHDEITAQTSHVPHLLAYALAGSVSLDSLRYAGSGFRDSTRLAGSNPQLWLDIALSNRDSILTALQNVQGRLQQMRKALEARDESTLLNLFSEGRKVRHALGS